MQCEINIEALGAGGDGIGQHDGVTVFIAGALPGERVRAELGPLASGGYHARLLERLSDSAARTIPPCEYFGICGGCVAQHMAHAPYVAWKLESLTDALAHRGLGDIAPAPLIACPPASRRRARLALSYSGVKGKSGPALGFRQRGSSEVVDIAHCAILLPELVALLAPLRHLAARIPGGLSEASLTRAPVGCDVILHGLAALPDLALREDLAAFIQHHGIARLSVESRAGGWQVAADRSAKGGRRKSRGKIRKRGRNRGQGRERAGAGLLEVIAQPGVVQAQFGAAAVALPPGAFLQATAFGEAAIGRQVLAGLELAGARRAHVADLYAGIGAIGFGLAVAGHRVAMFEGDAAMAAAGAAAARAAGIQVSAEVRDLARRPLSVAELKPFDAVVFDPPRSGARAQAEMLAASGVARIAAISCNPASFARDARILIDGGYRLSALTPIDQFLWSSHVELVAIFQRDAR